MKSIFSILATLVLTFLFSCSRFQPNDYFKELDDLCEDDPPKALEELRKEDSCLYDNAGNAAKALECLHECLDVLPQGDEKDALHGRCLFKIANILMAREIYDTSLEYLQEALDSSEKKGDVLWRCMALRDIAWCQTKLGNTPKAVEAYEKGLALARKEGHKKAEARLCTQYASLLVELGDFKKAEHCITLFYQISDSLDNVNASEMVAKTSSLYNYQPRERENQSLNDGNHGKTLLAWGFGLACLIALLLSITVWLLMQKEKRGLALRNNLLKQATKDREELVKKIDEQSQQMQIRKERHLLDQKKRDLALESVMKSDAYKKFAKASTKGISEDDPLRDGLEEAVAGAFHNWEDTLVTLKRMNAQQKHVTLLVKVHFSPTDIARITNKSRSAISSTRMRLFTSNFGKKDAKAEDWDVFVQAI